MAIRILVNGADGKMGKEAVKALEQDNTFRVVGKNGKKQDLAQAITESRAEIVVDFTTASVAFANACAIIQAGAHPVIGTTGFLPEQIAELQKRCAKKKLGGIIAPNFSLAAILMMQFAQQAAKYFSQVEIIEMHHPGKEDSPSGTSLRTAEFIAQGRGAPPALKKPLETVPGARGALYHDIPIHAVRLPGLMAHQTVIFGGRGETLTIRHDSLHRESYMAGVKLACEKVLQVRELVYGLEKFL